MKTTAPPQLPIFRSDGQARLLARLFVPGTELSLTELQDAAGLSAGAVHREVERLEQAGILCTRRVGRTRIVSPNPASPFHGELQALLTKAFGPAPLLRDRLGVIEGVEAASIYGSWAARGFGAASREPRDIDVLVIGTPDIDAVYSACRSVEDQISVPVNPTVLTRGEWNSDRSGFAQTVRDGPRVPLLGNDDG